MNEWMRRREAGKLLFCAKFWPGRIPVFLMSHSHTIAKSEERSCKQPCRSSPPVAAKLHPQTRATSPRPSKPAPPSAKHTTNHPCTNSPAADPSKYTTTPMKKKKDMTTTNDSRNNKNSITSTPMEWVQRYEICILVKEFRRG